MIHREDWERVAEEAQPYLHYDHLRALEDAMTDTMEFRYVIHYCPENRPMGIAYFQVVELKDNGSAYQKAVKDLGQGIGRRIISDMQVRCLVNGNVFHCGDHGGHFIGDITDAQRFAVVENTMRMLGKSGHFQKKPSMLLVKDIWPRQFNDAEVLEEKRHHPLAMDVNMIMDLDPAWSDLNAYEESLNSKNRTRLRAIMKRSDSLEIRDLSAEDIRVSTKRLQELFDEVLDRSPFTFGRLKVEVYSQWKEQLGEALMFRGYYLNDELVGFNAAFVIGDSLDAQYVGIDQRVNQEHGVYQRMLVDLLMCAMEKRLDRILFGRTAEQAKSNLGAEPVGMRFYAKHRNRLANKLIGPFLRSIRPSAFEQRSPFKKLEA